jgi:signal transduction histidine kinase
MATTPGWSIEDFRLKEAPLSSQRVVMPLSAGVDAVLTIRNLCGAARPPPLVLDMRVRYRQPLPVDQNSPHLANSADLSILLIEDDAADARLIREMVFEVSVELARRLRHVDRLAAGIEAARATHTDLVLLDLSLPDASGFDTFRRLQAAVPTVPVVILSGLSDEAMAVRSVQGGAQDYLVKGHVDGATLVRAMRYAIERKRMDVERRELGRQRDEFFAGVSHDLRTPVAAIKASIEAVLANEPAGLPGPLHRLLVNIDLAADELSNLVEDLLELARLEAGRVDLRRVECDLRDVASRALASVEPLAAQRNQRIELDAPEPVMARVDPERLRRALTNLLANAQKYGRSGGEIRLSVLTEGEASVLSVRDDGPGIALDEQDRIFERFYRSPDGTTRARQGTGLGLPIARALVALHGGTLSVESSPGAGATFQIRLPTRHPAP